MADSLFWHRSIRICVSKVHFGVGEGLFLGILSLLELGSIRYQRLGHSIGGASDAKCITGSEAII
jgi:hypothetical protein